MKQVIIGFAGLLMVALPCRPAAAWCHAGAFGTASGGGGSWSGSGFRGGTASGGDGSWHANSAYGGSASGGGGSWHATGAEGGTASGGEGYWHGTTASGTTAYGGYDAYHGATYYGGTYSTYHPPTVVDNYYGTGCYDCGGWNAAGAAAVGVAAGTMLGAASANAANANANANAYAAGVAAGESYAMGAIYTTLPAGCVYSTVGPSNYYSCNGTWFSPSYGANGVYYRVVPPP
jgi:hypothetical protein